MKEQNMTAPVVSSIVFDKTSYVKGDLMTVTIGYLNGSSAVTQQFTGTATDSTSGQTGSLTVNFTVIDPDLTAISVSDSGNRVWTPGPNNGSTAVYTAIA